MAMTSRERVRLALEHREPDRVPVDLGASYVTGICASAYARFREALDLEKRPPRISEIFQMLAEVEPDVLERVGGDVLGISPRVGLFGIVHEEYKAWTLFDGTEVLVPVDFNVVEDEKGDLLISPGGDTSRAPSGRMPRGGYYFDGIVRQEEIDEENLRPEEFARQFTRFTDEDLEHIRTLAESLHRNTDKALLGGFYQGGLGDWPQVVAPGLAEPKGIRDPEQWLLAHLTHPEYIREIFHLQTERAIENLGLYREAVGDRIEAVIISGTDFGAQQCEIIPPDLYRELYMPFHRKMNDWVHTHTPWKTFYHCCGSIPEILPLLVEAGMDVLNPVQCSAGGMDPRWLKENFGRRITFWGGGVDTQKTLPFGRRGEVREEVRERIQVFAPGGGFVFNTIHNIQNKTPPENLVAMYEALRDYGRYPIR